MQRSRDRCMWSFSKARDPLADVEVVSAISTDAAATYAGAGFAGRQHLPAGARKIVVPEAAGLSFRHNRLFGAGLTRSSVLAFGRMGGAG